MVTPAPVCPKATIPALSFVILVLLNDWTGLVLLFPAKLLAIVPQPALGQKQTCAAHKPMSDMCQTRT